MHHKALVNSIGASLLRTDQAVALDHEQLQNSECFPHQLSEAETLGDEASESGAGTANSFEVSSSSRALDGRLVLYFGKLGC